MNLTVRQFANQYKEWLVSGADRDDLKEEVASFFSCRVEQVQIDEEDNITIDGMDEA